MHDPYKAMRDRYWQGLADRHAALGNYAMSWWCSAQSSWALFDQEFDPIFQPVTVQEQRTTR